MTSQQRKQLRALAHHLEPVCYVGKNGLTDALIQSVNQALDDHELIKVRFVDRKEERRELAPRLAQETHSDLAGLVGNVAILYRQQADPEKRRIHLE